MADANNPATAQADADAHAYEHGKMEINEQASTYDLFIHLAKWGSLSVAVVLVFLVTWFQPSGSFLVALLAALVLAAVGVVALKSKPQKSH